jgi:hypothetical protein
MTKMRFAGASFPIKIPSRRNFDDRGDVAIILALALGPFVEAKIEIRDADALARFDGSDLLDTPAAFGRDADQR